MKTAIETPIKCDECFAARHCDGLCAAMMKATEALLKVAESKAPKA